MISVEDTLRQHLSTVLLGKSITSCAHGFFMEPLTNIETCYWYVIDMTKLLTPITIKISLDISNFGNKVYVHILKRTSFLWGLDINSSDISVRFQIAESQPRVVHCTSCIRRRLYNPHMGLYCSRLNVVISPPLPLHNTQIIILF